VSRPDFPHFIVTDPTPDNRCIGDYRLKEMRAENETSRLWLAEQVSISRLVLLDELRPERSELRQAFLANIRAKAAVDHPLIGSVYEAADGESHCFAASEWLAAATLQDRLQAGEPLAPGRVAQILRRLAEAQLYHQAAGHATRPLGLHHIHCDDHDVVRIDNLVVAGARAPDQSSGDIARLGETLRPLVADAQPGTTRLRTLLSWMRGEGIDTPLDWGQVREICEQIEQQLVNPTPTTPGRPGRRAGRKPSSPIALAVMGILAISVVLVLAIRMRPQKPGPAPRPALPDSILISSGAHPTPDGSRQNLEAFRISPHEVTIGQYAGFLEILDTLAKDGRERAFDHPEQPPEKTSHQPHDWAALLAAAKKNSTWNQRPVTTDCPVVGVDWWDAAAYAEWKKARLPTQEQWYAALHLQTEKPAAIAPADWVPVGTQTTDRTPAGLLAMAGSVSEWTRLPAVNPANPLGGRNWVIIGGSFLKPGSNALSREWTADRSLRRADLGFRLVFDME
jgi:hypothetical protein